MKNVCTILTLVLCLVFTQSAMAVTTPATAPAAKTELAEKEMSKKESRQLKKQERKAEKLQKRIAKFEKKMEKRAARGNDDSKKWLKLWVIGLIATIVLPILALAVVGTSAGGFGFAGVLLLLTALIGIFTTVAFIIWLIKKFG